MSNFKQVRELYLRGHITYLHITHAYKSRLKRKQAFIFLVYYSIMEKFLRVDLNPTLQLT